MIATPMYGSMCVAGYAISMINLMQEVGKLDDLKVTPMFALNESLIPKTRSMIVHAFLKSDATHLLFIDSDVSFNALELIKMMRSERDVVCGIYPKKIINWQRVHHAALHGTAPEGLQSLGMEFLFIPESTMNPEEDGLIEIKRAGTGMMMIRRNVFEQLADKVKTFKLEGAQENVSNNGEHLKEYFFSSIDSDTGVYLHEDFTFCKLWRENGGKIHAAPWVHLQHTGMHMFG